MVRDMMRKIQNYTPQNFEERSNGSLKRKRQQPTSSCRTCRSRKVACDRQHPCRTCVQLGLKDQCVYDGETDVRDALPTNGQSNSKLEHGSEVVSVGRIAHLENLVAGLAARLDAVEGSTHGSPGQHATTPKNPHAEASIKGTNCRDGLFYISSHNWTMPFSEDMAYLWINYSFYQHQFAAIQDLCTHFDPVRRRTMWACVVPSVTSGFPSENEMLSLLPDEQTCDDAVDCYLITLNRIHPVVKEAMLRQEIQSFRSRGSPPSAPWLALYLAIVALGLQLPVVLRKDSARRGGRARGKGIMKFVQHRVLQLLSQARRPTTSGFQIVILLVLQQAIDLDWVDGADITNGYVGILTRMSATMGLHRDSGIIAEMHKELTPEEADLRRDLFWTATHLDMEHSLQSGTPFRLTDEDHDVMAPFAKSAPWGHYLPLLAQLVPLSAQIMQISHSQWVNVSSQRIDSLQTLFRAFRFRLRDATDDVSLTTISTSDLIAVKVQQAAIWMCLNRLELLLAYMKWKSAEVSRKGTAELEILRHADATVHQGLEVLELIAKQDESTRLAWSHYAISFLRCYLCNAMSWILSMTRVSRALRTTKQPDLTTSVVFQRLKRLLSFFDSLDILSFEIAKQRAYFCAQFSSVEEHIRACPNNELAGNELDAESVEGRLVALITQQSLDKAVQQTVQALAKARQLDDPPANLLTTPVEDSKPRPMPVVQPTQSSADRVSEQALPSAEWFMSLDDSWFNSNVLLDDVAAGWFPTEQYFPQ